MVYKYLEGTEGKVVWKEGEKNVGDINRTSQNQLGNDGMESRKSYINRRNDV